MLPPVLSIMNLMASLCSSSLGTPLLFDNVIWTRAAAWQCRALACQPQSGPSKFGQQLLCPHLCDRSCRPQQTQQCSQYRPSSVHGAVCVVLRFIVCSHFDLICTFSRAHGQCFGERHAALDCTSSRTPTSLIVVHVADAASGFAT